MKLLHLGDLHLGRSLGDYDLQEDQKYIIEQLLQIIKKEAVDCVLIAGDIYDKAVPSEAATNLLDYFLGELSASGAKSFFISGNHDSDDRLHYGSGLFESNQIYIASIYGGTLYKKTVEDEFGEVDIWLLPFVKASQVRHYFPEAKIESYDDAVRTVLENAGIDKERRNVLVAHQFVTGKASDGTEACNTEDYEPVLGGSEGIAAQSVGLVEKIGYDCFDGFDYVALGHIHSPQQVGRETVRYSGSPLKYSLSEVNNSKSVPIITMGGKGDVSVKLMPLKPLRDMRHLVGTLEEILDKNNVKAPEDFIYVTLTDEEIINEAMGIIRQTYPNTLKLDYDNSHTKALENMQIPTVIENKSFEEIISDFYTLMYGCDISEEEMKYLRMAAREAGVMNEAD